MPQINYSLISSKNDGLPISASELTSLYFFGTPIIDPSGNQMSDKDIEFYIRAASEEVEGYLNLKLSKQVIEESNSYYLKDYRAWGYVPTSYPVICSDSLTGFIGDVEQVIWPSEWLSGKKTNDGIGYERMIHIVPTVGSASSGSVVYSGITPNVGWFGQQTIPNYWTITYCTSFDILPGDILEAVGKQSTINIFHQLGDIILGAGIASQSIGIDGLSQSISSTASSTSAGFGARIIGYREDLKKALPKLKAKYDGFTMTSM